MNTPIDPTINFAGSPYNIFPVGYSNGGHSIAKIQMEDAVYEYDGVVRRDLLQVLSNRNPFTNRIKTLRGVNYSAQTVWNKVVNF
jgi:hypothetical protein